MHIDQWELHLVNIDDPGHSQTIADFQTKHNRPWIAAMSPASEDILFWGYPGTSVHPSLFLFNLESPAKYFEIATSLSVLQPLSSARFSPNGELVAYVQSDRGTDVAKIFLRRVSDLSESSVVLAEDMSVSIGRYAFTAWGDYIIYTSTRGEITNHHLELVSIADPSIRVRIDHDFKSSSAWFLLSPNRRMLAYETMIPGADEPIIRFVDLSEFGVRSYSDSDMAGLSLAHEYTFPFSPDSLSFIMRTKDENGSEQLYRQVLDTPTEWTPINPTAGDSKQKIAIGYYPMYTPDSSKLIYLARLDDIKRG